MKLAAIIASVYTPAVALITYAILHGYGVI